MTTVQFLFRKCRRTQRIILQIVIYPLFSGRQHLSSNDCLEDKREDYRDCFVLWHDVYHNCGHSYEHSSSYRWWSGLGNIGQLEIVGFHQREDGREWCISKKKGIADGEGWVTANALNFLVLYYLWLMSLSGWWVHSQILCILPPICTQIHLQLSLCSYNGLAFLWPRSQAKSQMP